MSLQLLDNHLHDSGWDELDEEDFDNHRQEIISSIERKVLLEGRVRRGKLAGVLHLPWVSMTAAAAVVLLAVGLYVWMGNDDPSQQVPIVATQLVRDQVSTDGQVVESAISRPGWDDLALDLDTTAPARDLRFNFSSGDSSEIDTIGPDGGSDSYPIGL